MDKIIAPSGINDRLDVIHAGPVPPNPSELLLSNRLEELVNTLRERYDYVILDNVPAGMVADATIVNRVADLTVYVIRAGLMDRRQLPEVEKLYKQEKFLQYGGDTEWYQYETCRLWLWVWVRLWIWLWLWKRKISKT